MRDFVEQLVDGLIVESGNVRVALITFSDNANLQFDLSRVWTRYGLHCICHLDQ